MFRAHWAKPHFMINGVAGRPMLFFVATIFALASSGDLRIIRIRAPSWGARLRRHPLAQMCSVCSSPQDPSLVESREARRHNPSRTVSSSAPNACDPILLLIFLVRFYWLCATPYGPKFYNRLRMRLASGEGMDAQIVVQLPT